MQRARIGIELGAAHAGAGQAARPRPEHQGRARRRRRPGQPGRQGGPQAGRRDHRRCGENGRQPAGVPAQGRRQRRRQVVRARATSARARSRRRRSPPRPAEKVVFDLEREQGQRSGRVEAAEPAKTAISDFGLEVQPLTPELAKQLGLPADRQGLARQHGQGGQSRPRPRGSRRATSSPRSSATARSSRSRASRISRTWPRSPTSWPLYVQSRQAAAGSSPCPRTRSKRIVAGSLPSGGWRRHRRGR